MKFNIEKFMLAMCFLYASCFMLVPFLGRTAEVILVFSFLLIINNSKYKLFKDKTIYLLFSSFIIIIISWISIRFLQPELAVSYPDLRFFLRLFVFIPIAYWLKGNTKYIHFFLIISALALVLSTFTRGEGIEEWINGIKGQRVDFKLINAQHTTLLMAIALLGIITHAIPQITSQWKSYTLNKKVIYFVSSGLSFIIFFTGVLISQTRGVWLALIISFAITGAIYLFRINHISIKKSSLILTLLLSFLTLQYFLPFDSIVKTRIKAESSVIMTTLEDGIESVPFTSIGVRLHSWYEALKWIKKRPILGSGELAKKEIIQRSDFPQWVKSNFRHLHNYYIEVLVSYGFLGILLIILLYCKLSKITYSLWNDNIIPSSLAYFTYSSLITLLVANNFESYNSMWSGWIIHNIVISTIYSYYIYRGENETTLHHI
ncbi:O-antigen ligase family protein [Vibrio cincinnatiensis]|uniref:O-antigen ligase family protein n=1 Tax=Vibrio cincinnatiensis TaxID=675 RepID=UPI00130280FE|nr:O-antigen ligase family protein [Vibrio cincinnatiensis]